MRNKRDSKPRLRLIQGGQRRETQLGDLKVVLAPREEFPFPVEAVVFEEDTYLVLSASTIITDVVEHPVRVLTEAFQANPAMPGSVIVKGRRPFRFFAIVHDLDQDPTWREEWVAKALEGIFLEAEQRQLKSLCLPMLGTLHGSMGRERFIELMRGTLECLPKGHLRRLWLEVPGELVRQLFAVFDSWEDG